MRDSFPFPIGLVHISAYAALMQVRVISGHVSSLASFDKARRLRRYSLLSYVIITCGCMCMCMISDANRGGYNKSKKSKRATCRMC